VVESIHRFWQDVLGEVQLALNWTVRSVTKASPLELIGKEARPLGVISPCDTEIEIAKADLRDRAIENINKQAKYDKLRFAI